MSRFLITCDCGKKTEFAELDNCVGWFEEHRHYPSILTVKCLACGEEHKTGPGENLRPVVRAARDIQWEADHQHVGAAA